MNIFRRLYRGVKSVYTGGISLMDAAAGRLLSESPVTSSGSLVTDETMLRVSTAFACIRILSETLGSLPWALYRKDDSGNAVRADDHPLTDVLVYAPNGEMTSVEYREALTLYLCQRGNAYSFIDRIGKRITALTPLDPKDVRIKVGDDKRSVTYEYNDRGKWEPVPRERMWHIKGFGKGVEGLSPLGAAREALGMAMSAERFGALFFGQGGKPAGIVTVPTFFKNKEQRDIARENLNQMMGGLGNAHKFALFEGGMKPQTWGDMSLDDMQFILTRKFSIQEICRFYRIPPHMVADLDRATFSNIEHMSLEFVQFTLMPYFTRIESSVSKWLLTDAERRTVFLRFNYEGLLRADSKGRSEFYASALQNGWMSRNEVRAKENLNNVDEEGMDDYTVQVNLAPVDKMDVEPVEPTQPVVPALNAPEDDTMKQQPINTFNMVMPETVKHHISQRVEVPDVPRLISSVADLAAAAKKTADQSSLSIAALIGTVQELTRKSEETAAELKKLAQADRMAIFDEKGNPIGTRVVVH